MVFILYVGKSTFQTPINDPVMLLTVGIIGVLIGAVGLTVLLWWVNVRTRTLIAQVDRNSKQIKSLQVQVEELTAINFRLNLENLRKDAYIKLLLESIGQQPHTIQDQILGIIPAPPRSQRMITTEITGSRLCVRTPLTSKGLDTLGLALANAFPRIVDLQRVVMVGLADRELRNVISWDKPTLDVCLEIIDWTESRSTTNLLVRAAQVANPTNRMLQGWINEYCEENDGEDRVNTKEFAR